MVYIINVDEMLLYVDEWIIKQECYDLWNTKGLL